MRNILCVATLGAGLVMATAPAMAKLASADRGFVDASVRANLTEIQDAKWAAKTEVPQPLRRLGEEIIRNHTALMTDIKQIAQHEAFSLPAMPRVAQQQQRDELKNLTGKALHQRYLQEEVQRHETAIQRLQQEIREGQDPSLKKFAQYALPVMQGELRSVQDTAAKL